ncbi:MAG TPA: tRNA-uridine aminocarboxypropyltransferase [Telluria sp.]|nr:tRNA-uridine aminocarboxypropyltransferase [Telluria sp.]
MKPYPSDTTRPPSRQRCARCLRPQSACICGWIAPVDSTVRLLILQHPMEVDHAKGSARLLQLSVAGATMVTGETFDPVELQRLLEQEGRIPLLLYPELPGERALGIAAPPAIDPAALAQPSRLLLVVLDGTWRKSRKMLYLNSLLQTLPRLGLAQMAPSHYRIRKAHAPDQLSTLEATCHALGQLEGAPQRYLALLDNFDAFVARFQATGGRLAP